MRIRYIILVRQLELTAAPFDAKLSSSTEHREVDRQHDRLNVEIAVTLTELTDLQIANPADGPLRKPIARYG